MFATPRRIIINSCVKVAWSLSVLGKTLHGRSLELHELTYFLCSAYNLC